MGSFAFVTTILPIIVTCSATPVPTQVLKEYSNPSFLTQPVNYWINHDGYEERKNFVNMIEPMHRAKRSPLCKRSPSPCLIKTKKKLKIVTSPKWKPKKKKKIAKEILPAPLPSPLRIVALKGGKKALAPIIKGSKGIPKLGPKGLALLTLASAPLVVPVKKPLSLKAAPKLVKAGPKVAGPLALSPLALGAKTLPAGAKVLKTTPLLVPAVLKKGPLVASPLLLPLAGKAAKAKKLAIPAILQSQSQGGGSQRRGSSSSGGRNRTRDCNRNGSSCAGEEDTPPAEDEVTTRAPTEEEKEAALEAKAALEEAQTTINQAQAAMQEALAAMRGAQLSNLSSLNRGRR